MPTSLTTPSLKGESLKIIAIMLVGYTAFSFCDAGAKYLTQTYSPSYLVTMGAIMNASLMVIWIVWRKGLKGFQSQKKKWLWFRATTVGITALCIVTAFSYIPIADVYGVTFAAPFVSVILAVIFLKEVVGLHRWLSVIIGFIGVIVLAGPQFETLNIGLVYAIIACTSSAMGPIIVRKIGKNVYMPLLFLYAFLGMLVVNTPIALSDFQTIGLPPLFDLVLILGNGLLVLLGVGSVSYGLAHAQSTASVAPFVYTQVIWAVLFGILLFDNIPTLATIAGLTIVVSAGLYMMYRERQLRKLNPITQGKNI